MWHKPFMYTVLGAVIALSTTVNTLVGGLITPLLSAVTGGKGAYV